MVKDFAKGLAEPFVRTGVTAAAPVVDAAKMAKATFQDPAGMAKAFWQGKDAELNPEATKTVKSATATKEGLNVPGFGMVRPNRIGTDIEDQGEGQGPFGRETLKTIGTGAELASWYGGGEAMNALRLAKNIPLKHLLFKEGQLGLATGATGGFGIGAQDEEATAGSIAGSTALGGGLGLAAGVGAPLLFKGLSKAYKGMKGWNEAADEAVEQAMALQKAEQSSAEKMGRVTSATGEPLPVKVQAEEGLTTPMSPPTPVGPVTPVQSLADLSDSVAEFFPSKAPDAMPVDQKIADRAVKAGFKEWQPRVISDMSQAERDAARSMLAMAEDKSKNILARHPMEKAAEPIIAQVDHLSKVRDSAGASLDTLVDSMPKNPLPLREPIEKLSDWLGKSNIDVEVGKDGKITGLDFSRSKFSTSFSGKDQQAIKEVFAELFPPQAKGQVISRTPEEIRTIRQRLRQIVEAQKKSTEPFSSEVENLISGLRTELNKPLADISPEYAIANQNYAVATDALETFYRFLGKDFYGASKEDMLNRIQDLLPRLVSNTASKPSVIFKDLLEAATKTGMSEQAISDPRRLVYFANMLDNTYDLNAPRGFQGSIESGIENAANKLSAGGQIVTSAARLDPLGVVKGAASLFKPDEALRRRKLLKEMVGEAVSPTSMESVKNTLGRQGSESAFGAMAGIEPQFDEEGNPIGMKYDPLKGALGVAGGIAVGKMKKGSLIDDIARAKASGQSFDEWVSKQFSRPEYGMSHRPTYEGAPPAYNLLEGDMLPRDVYTNPDFSISSGRIGDGDKAANESWKALQKIKGKPDAEITIYRAAPKKELNIGDWVTFSKDYAKQSVEGTEKVHAFKVKAKDVIFAGDDINEFGYYPVSQFKTEWDNVADSVAKPFTGFTDLSLKTLEKLKGRTTVSKQFIEDLAKTPDLKQAERDVINEALAGIKGKDVNVEEFANKVKAELLPLKVESSAGGTPRYENIALPDDLRGPIANYEEHVYNSPIKTSAGNVHWGEEGAEGYFGHTRVEDLPHDLPITEPTPGAVSFRKIGEGKYGVYDKEGKLLKEQYEIGHEPRIRRIIEVQSDLYQRGRLEREMPEIKHLENQKARIRENYDEYVKADLMSPEFAEKKYQQDIKAITDEYKQNVSDVTKLQQYSNPTAHFRMIREEVKRAAQDGKTKLQFPTGETAMKIEGLGQAHNPWRVAPDGKTYREIPYGEMKVGQEIKNTNSWDDWIITDVLGDGKFKAVPKSVIDDAVGMEELGYAGPDDVIDEIRNATKGIEGTALSGSDVDLYRETFDISGSVDKENPIYKFYDKEVASYVKKKYGAEKVRDAQGIEWWEIKLKPEMGKDPVEAFAAVPALALGDSMRKKEEKKKKSK